MSTLAIRSNRGQETVSKPKYSVKKQNWIIISGNSMDAKASFSFKKDRK